MTEQQLFIAAITGLVTAVVWLARMYLKHLERLVSSYERRDTTWQEAIAKNTEQIQAHERATDEGRRQVMESLREIAETLRRINGKVT